MKRKPTTSILAFAMALSAPLAFADDNSMSRLTGDSYAYFNDLDYHAGGFNTPRLSAAQRHEVVETPRDTQEARGRPMLLAARPHAPQRSPFSDDKGA